MTPSRGERTPGARDQSDRAEGKGSGEEALLGGTFEEMRSRSGHSFLYTFPQKTGEEEKKNLRDPRRARSARAWVPFETGVLGHCWSRGRPKKESLKGNELPLKTR